MFILCPTIIRNHIFRCGPRQCAEAIIARLHPNQQEDGYTLTLDGTGAARAPKSLLSFHWGHHADEIIHIVIGEGITELESGIFRNLQNLRSVTFPNTLTAIYSDAFAHCECIEMLCFPDSLEYIGPGAFQNCMSLHTIQFGTGIRTIQAQAFAECIRLRGIQLPERLQKLGEDAFHRCISLSHLQLPSGITTISRNTFKHCTGLESIVLGSGIERITDGAFYKCSSLRFIDLRNARKLKTVDDSAFQGCRHIETIRCTPAQKLLLQRYFQKVCSE